MRVYAILRLLVCKGVRIAGIAVLLLSAFIVAVNAEPHALGVGDAAPGKHAFQDFLAATCQGSCVLKQVNGGDYEDYHAAVKWELSHRSSIALNGDCASYCVYFMFQIAQYACVTEHARLLFHQMRIAYSDQSGRIVRIEKIPKDDPRFSPYPEAIKKWLAAHGGIPFDGYTVMDAAAAKGFLRPCDKPPEKVAFGLLPR